MGTIPVLTPREVTGLLLALGFQEVRQRGSQKQYRQPDGRGTTVPSALESRMRHRLGRGRAAGRPVTKRAQNYSLNWTAGQAPHFELATSAAAGYFSRWRQSSKEDEVQRSR
jgi:predicted RNA binding protein YcfA (HicA-like mRNA interferase family)